MAAKPENPGKAKAPPLLVVTVNGSPRGADSADGQMPLIYWLRDELRLTGTHLGCGKAECGACTVLLDGEPVRACQVQVEAAAGRSVTTIEGLGTPEAPHPVQAAFIAEQAAQCGFCTPGLVMESVALLARTPHPDRANVKNALDGHLCRCGSHHRVLRAVLRAGGGAGS